MSKNDLIKALSGGELDEKLKKVYVTNEEVEKQRKRYAELYELFCEEFGEADEVSFLSAPGRTEVCGNHTDHNNGKVLAASINLDAVAVAKKVNGNITRVKSVGHSMDTVDILDMNVHTELFSKSSELIRGVCAEFIERGYNVGAFEAYTTSDVLSGSGLSSSAAFEVLIGTVLNHLFNDGKVSAEEIAQIAQKAENKYFGKPCGLMDQMASSVGSFVKIDFEDTKNPIIEKVDFDFSSSPYALCIVDTGGSHSDLTNEYAAVRKNMESVAEFFGKKVLREVDEKEFYSSVAKIRSEKGDVPVLRAMHYFEDNKRVDKEAEALAENNFDEFMNLVIESGRSSYMYNQNVYPCSAPDNQNLSVALATAERILKGKGAWRVHGGGFAGTMQAFVPNDMLDEYTNEMKAIYGEKSCYVLSIRPVGGVKVI